MEERDPGFQRAGGLVKEMGFEEAASVGLSKKEWEFLISVLERRPSPEELQMIAVQWSEHCSYKSSKKWLRRLISEGPSLLQGPGENAGIVRLDEQRAVAFKIESHNHPSFVEPFQGAATGVGGILRDIFTMGARPVAVGNFLRFGELSDPKHQYLLRGVVAGISHYGNCVGIPNLLGQLHTDASYNGNILVNVFALGLIDPKKIFRSDTAQPGQKVMIWGARTGRDGIHGASLLASADFDEGETAEQKIRVQVGDPFKEKCLMEACLEAMESLPDEIAAIQDMGAAGLTCSTMEIAFKSQCGMRISLDKVPQREKEMQAYELLLSESQERMLAVVKPGSEESFARILKKWGCEAEVIGETIVEPYVKMSFKGDQVVNLPIQNVMDPPPADLPEPKPAIALPADSTEARVPEDVRDEWSVLKEMLALPRLASKRSVYERYDSSVGASSVYGPGQEAAVLWCGEQQKDFVGLGMKGACDEKLARFEPRLAASLSMAEAARGLACVGAMPLGYTDGVNLGNPLQEEVQWALAETVEGLNEAAEVFQTPCVGGNVSLYNQTRRGEERTDIDPSTFVVMVGKIEDVRKSKPASFQKAGNEIWLLEVPGNPNTLPAQSVYAREFWSEEVQASLRGVKPWLDLKKERVLCEALWKAHEEDLCVSVRDVSDGGLAVSLAEACFSGERLLGLDGDLSKSKRRRDFLLFDESAGRVIAEVESSKRAAWMKLSRDFGLQSTRIGVLTEEARFRIRPLMLGDLNELAKAWDLDFVA